MKYFSLFSGIGGFELGIQNAYENIRPIQQKVSQKSKRSNLVKNELQQWECEGYSEIDKYAISVYKYHLPTHKNYGDITKIITAELPDFDLLVGGFPCQSFSIAGKRGGFQDTRGTLFFEIARIAKDKRPAYLLLENVKGLLNHDKGNTFATIISTLDELGYDCEWHVNNSKNFGVPQNRERVFIIGHLRGQPRPKVFPIGETTTGDYKTKFPNIPEIGEAIRIYESDGIAPPTKPHHTLIAYFRGDEGLRIRKNNIAPTLKKRSESEDHYNSILAIKDNRIRRLTPTECERLQAFPDDWTKFGINEKGEKVEISDSQRYKMCGNALTTNVVEEIIKRLLTR
ncbi:MAG: DNA cytosine methyltransferase [Atribacterota bacterium]|nr:DNA cytosine methyltransferase [Atribacterota bacterium]